MKRRPRILTWLAVLLAAWAACPPAALARTKGQVLASIKARYPSLLKLLAAKKVGETFNGFVAAVRTAYLQDKIKVQGRKITIAQFIQEENADRSEYFQIKARETNTTPQVVAQNFGQVRLSRLKKGEYWKGADGKWMQKG